MIMAKQKKKSEIIIQIDGKEVKAAEGMTVLEAAQSADIFIPTLCFHEKLKPHGLCRMLRIHPNCRIWLKSMEQTKTVSKKSPRFAFFLVYV